MKPEKYISIIITLLFALFISCEHNNIASSHYINIGADGIKQSEEYLFSNLSDTLAINENKKHDLLISIRYSDLCKFSTLPLEIEYGSLNSDSISKKSIDIRLFDKNGKPFGKGKFGFYESTVPFISDIFIDPSFFISLYTKQASISGINSIGVILKN